MGKINKTIRISEERWAQIQAAALEKEWTPSQWILDSIIGRLDGLLRPVPGHVAREDVIVPQKGSKGRKSTKEKELPSLVQQDHDLVFEDNPLMNTPEIKRIRKLQQTIKDKEAEYESYLNGVAPEDREKEKEAWYVKEVKEQLEAARAELHELTKHYKFMSPDLKE